MYALNLCHPLGQRHQQGRSLRRASSGRPSQWVSPKPWTLNGKPVVPKPQTLPQALNPKPYIGKETVELLDNDYSQEQQGETSFGTKSCRGTAIGKQNCHSKKNSSSSKMVGIVIASSFKSHQTKMFHAARIISGANGWRMNNRCLKLNADEA